VSQREILEGRTTLVRSQERPALLIGFEGRDGQISGERTCGNRSKQGVKCRRLKEEGMVRSGMFFRSSSLKISLQVEVKGVADRKKYLN